MKRQRRPDRLLASPAEAADPGMKSSWTFEPNLCHAAADHSNAEVWPLRAVPLSERTD